MSHAPAASRPLWPAASTTIAATEQTPTAPASSGTSLRPRERTSNQASTARNGTATSPGTQNPAAARITAPTASAAMSANSPAATRCARHVRSRTRPRPPVDGHDLQRGPCRNATSAASAMHTPAAPGAISSPSSPGSRVSPQPPCSLGSATDRHGVRRVPAGGPFHGGHDCVTMSEARRCAPRSASRWARALTTGGAARTCPPGRRTGPRGRTSRCRPAPRSPRSRPGCSPGRDRRRPRTHPSGPGPSEPTPVGRAGSSPGSGSPWWSPPARPAPPPSCDPIRREAPEGADREVGSTCYLKSHSARLFDRLPRAKPSTE